MITKAIVEDRAVITDYDLQRARKGNMAILDVYRSLEYSQKTDGKWLPSARAKMLHEVWQKRLERGGK